jgi:squalene-hopene/tetraprenyl-beta-curcumene cyclase
LIVVLSDERFGRYRESRDAWTRFLLERQLTEELGWQKADRAYGGWGYAFDPTPKPPSGQPLSPLAAPNLSATAFALEALTSAENTDHSLAVSRALVFVQRCQNFGNDTPLDDGGFFFIADDAVRNKAGSSGQDPAGHLRFASYGSTTADGVRSLQACGLPVDDPQVRAARQWLDRNFSASTHPGGYVRARESAKPALYFYYARSIARSWRMAPTEQVRDHAKALAAALIERQKTDGSWINDAVDVREDDPLVATPLAMMALADCQRVLSSDPR